MRRAGIAFAVALALLAVPSMSRAEGGPGEMKLNVPNMQGVTAWGILGFGYGASTGFGIGGRYAYPLTHESVIKNQSFQDRFVLEAGLDLVFASYDFVGVNGGVTVIDPVVGLMWDFWLNDKLALYPKIDLGYRIYSWSGTLSGFNGLLSNQFEFGASAGVIYKLDSINLRAELGNLGLKAGVMFPF